MKRYSYLGPLLAIPALVVILAAIPGCPTKEPPKTPEGPVGVLKKGPDGPEKKEKAEPFVVKSTDGVIKGRVVYDGTPPEMPVLKGIAGHGDAALCHAGPKSTQVEQTWLVGKTDGVANVVVFLEPPADKFFAIDEKFAEKYKNDATIDQPYCAFEPHVVAIFPEYKTEDGKPHPTGQELLIKNSGKIAHNSKSPGNGKVNAFNKPVNPGESERIEIKYQKQPLDVACDKHNWMSAKVLTFEHPFFAVTDKDGNFEIKNVPSGVELTIKTWHEGATVDTKKLDVKTGPNDAGTLKIKTEAS